MQIGFRLDGDFCETLLKKGRLLLNLLAASLKGLVSINNDTHDKFKRITLGEDNPSCKEASKYLQASPE